MNLVSFAIPGVVLITPERFGDQRGFFEETYNLDSFTSQGIDTVFVQDNHSLSGAVGTVRGLHFQAPPRAQAPGKGQHAQQHGVAIHEVVLQCRQDMQGEQRNDCPVQADMERQQQLVERLQLVRCQATQEFQCNNSSAFVLLQIYVRMYVCKDVCMYVCMYVCSTLPAF